MIEIGDWILFEMWYSFHLFISRPIACFNIRTDGTPLSLPDSSMYVLQVIPGGLPPSKASLPFIQMEGDPSMLRLTASS